MGAERQVATYLKCGRCGNQLSRADSSVEFYSCDKVGPDHPAYLVSSKFDTEAGDVLPTPMVKRRVSLGERIKRKLRSYLV